MSLKKEIELSRQPRRSSDWAYVVKIMCKSKAATVVNIARLGIMIGRAASVGRVSHAPR
jgi:hypothetical protein